MKIALYMEDGIEQIVLTPQSDFEKAILSKMKDSTRTLRIQTGSFYECNGGFVRQGSSDSSTIIVMTPKSAVDPAAINDASVSLHS